MSSYIKYYEFNECKAIKEKFHPGTYKIEAWGPSVGQISKGAYASGILKIKNIFTFFIHLGSSSNYEKNSTGGCNGGGRGINYYNHQLYGGGGSTDIRALKDTIYHRIIVAGGAGGCLNARNACGGGCVQSQQCNMPKGSFFYGGDAQADVNNGGGGGGGGSGWIGGDAACSSTSGSWTCGNGGSSYVLTQTSERVEGYMLSDRKEFFFENATMISGDTTMPSPKDGVNEVGHSGNGAVKITVLNYDFSALLNLCTKRSFSHNFGAFSFILTYIIC